MQAHSLTLERLAPPSAPIYCAGEVIAISPEGFAVRSEGGVLGARRAASCLLCPEMGDAVLVGGESSENVYVIAVLERANDSPSRLAVEGDLQLAASGSVSVSGQAGLSLSSPAHCVLSSEELTVRSNRATLLCERLSSFGSEINATVGRLRFIGNVMESVVERVMQTAKHSLRMVEGADQLRSGSLDYRAKETLNLHGRNVLATAKELVKADGAQIHLG